MKVGRSDTVESDTVAENTVEEKSVEGKKEKNNSVNNKSLNGESVNNESVTNKSFAKKAARSEAGTLLGNRRQRDRSTALPNSVPIPDLHTVRCAEVFGTPAYLYDRDSLESTALTIRSKLGTDVNIHFAIFCNSNPTLLQILRDSGVGVVVSSPAELFVAEAVGFRPSEIVVTGAAFSYEEMQGFLAKKLSIFVDSFDQLELVAELAGSSRRNCEVQVPGPNVGVRLNLTCGDRSQASDLPLNSCIGGQSRVGIWDVELAQFCERAASLGVRISGLHVYTGTNQPSDELLLQSLERLVKLALEIPSVRRINLGGGFGVPYLSGDEFPWDHFAERSKEILAANQKEGHPLQLVLEPGRSLVAGCGVLVAKILDVKLRPDSRIIVTTDASMSNFPRPYTYGPQGQHAISIASPEGVALEKEREVTICGNALASGDILGTCRVTRMPRRGDLITIRDAGAYCYSMSSRFSGRLRPREVLIDGGELRSIREPEVPESLLAGTEFAPRSRTARFLVKSQEAVVPVTLATGSADQHTFLE